MYGKEILFLLNPKKFAYFSHVMQLLFFSFVSGGQSAQSAKRAGVRFIGRGAPISLPEAVLNGCTSWQYAREDM